MMFKSIPSNLSILFHLICLCTTSRNSDYSASVPINKIILFLLEKSVENNSPSTLHFWGYFLIHFYISIISHLMIFSNLYNVIV